VVLKRALFFVTCQGKMMYPTKLEENYLVRNLTSSKDRIQFGSDGMTYRQMSLFDTEQFYQPPTHKDTLQAVTGQL
jgi:predicted DNA-binding helix-hairpin-helix protein